MEKIKYIVFLHILLMIYSMSSVFSKLTSKQTPFSMKFFICYGMVILLLGIYAIFWQQIIKELPLSMAFANKAVTVVWGLVWGVFLFGEKISHQKIVGVVMVVCGIVIFALPEDGDGIKGNLKNG